MAKKKSRHDIWKWLHTKYKVSATNESTLEEIWKIKATTFWAICLFLGFAFVLIAFTSFVIISTPIRNYLPGYLDSEVRKTTLEAAVRMDSLQQQLSYQEAYILNLKKIFAGEMDIDSVKNIPPIAISEDDPSLQKSEIEKQFTQQYAEDQKYNLSSISPDLNSPMEGVVFFKPVNGVVITKFDPSNKIYGISISTPARETVQAVMEGTISYSGYDARWGYVIQIQHRNGFISIYKHNTSLLKQAGDKVKTGEAIALIDGSKDKNPKEMYLYLELWYKGAAVNPEDYLSF